MEILLQEQAQGEQVVDNVERGKGTGIHQAQGGEILDNGESGNGTGKEFLRTGNAEASSSGGPVANSGESVGMCRSTNSAETAEFLRGERRL